MVDRRGSGEIRHGSPAAFRGRAGVDSRRHLDRCRIAKPGQGRRDGVARRRRALCVRASVCAGGRTGRGAALGRHRRTCSRASERHRSRLLAACIAQRDQRPLHSGALRTLCQGAESRRNAGRCERAAIRWRNDAIRSVHRRHEGRRIAAPVRRQAGPVAIAGDDHAAVDRYIARIRHAPRCRSGGDPPRRPSMRRRLARLPGSSAVSPTRTMAATRS